MKIVMEHPNLGPDRRETVNADQFELAWAPVGWVEVDRTYEPWDEDFVAVPTSELLPSWEVDDADLKAKVDKKGNVVTPAARVAASDAVLPPAKKASKTTVKKT